MDFPPETSSLLRGLLDNLTHNLHYTHSDLEGALNLFYEEIASMYDLKQRGLKLVSNS